MHHSRQRTNFTAYPVRGDVQFTTGGSGISHSETFKSHSTRGGSSLKRSPPHTRSSVMSSSQPADLVFLILNSFGPCETFKSHSTRGGSSLKASPATAEAVTTAPGVKAQLLAEGGGIYIRTIILLTLGSPAEACHTVDGYKQPSKGSTRTQLWFKVNKPPLRNVQQILQDDPVRDQSPTPTRERPATTTSSDETYRKDMKGDEEATEHDDNHEPAKKGSSACVKKPAAKPVGVVRYDDAQELQWPDQCLSSHPRSSGHTLVETLLDASTNNLVKTAELDSRRHLNQNELSLHIDHYVCADANTENLHNQLIAAIYGNVLRDVPDQGVAPWVSANDKSTFLSKSLAGDEAEQLKRVTQWMAMDNFSNR
ncbi:MAG: hypothetical protein Q9182_003004 [Xanthomendoza sp. 2 TL-2023]